MTTDSLSLQPIAEPALHFTRVFEENASWLWSVVRRLGVSERHVADVVHDLFVDLHRNLSHYDASRPLRPWLYGFAVRSAAAHKRKAHVRHEQPEGDVQLEGAYDSPEAELQSSQRRDFVLGLLQRLDEKMRDVLVMVDVDELPVPEAAALLGIPLNTAYSRLRLAREAFSELAKQADRRGEVP